MTIQLLEGGCVGLDAHTYDLLHAYTAEHNSWVATRPNNDGCPCAPVQISVEEMGRQILATYLHNWAQECRRGAK